jgi:hypothetical protein
MQPDTLSDASTMGQPAPQAYPRMQFDGLVRGLSEKFTKDLQSQNFVVF